jgi:CubicO group peptidase (beta-lactamase class C family)
MIYNAKVKFVEYKNKKLYILNTIDKDELNKSCCFLIGSITKVFTIFMLLILQQNNLLNINDKVDKYITSNKYNNFIKIIK